jgi:hypothetical protein
MELRREKKYAHTSECSKKYYLAMVAPSSFSFMTYWNVVAIASLVFFNVFSQDIFLAVSASHGCTFTARINMFLEVSKTEYTVLVQELLQGLRLIT